MKTLEKLKRRKTYWVLPMLAVFTLFIIACGDDAAPTPTATSAPLVTPTPTAIPRLTPTPTVAKLVSPRLIVTMAAPTGQVTAHYETFQSSGGHLHSLHEYLVGRDRVTSEEIPNQLALDWDVDASGRIWTFDLRENVPYYIDGAASTKYSEVTAKDVVHTWEIMAGLKDNTSASAGQWLAIVDNAEDWEIVNDHRIILHEKLVDLELPFRLSEEWTFGITSVDYWNDVGGDEGYRSQPMGSGSWSFGEHIVNEHILYIANKPHWRKAPEFDELELLWTAEPATRVAQLIAGEAHIAEIPRDLGAEVKARGMKIVKASLPGFHVLARLPYYRETLADGSPTPNHDPNNPLYDVRVRQAMNEAIDRATINDTIFLGEAIPDPVDFFPPWREDFKDEWAPVPGIDGKTGAAGGWPYPYDPDHAKQLLADAGYPDGFEFEFHTPPNRTGLPEIPAIGEAMAQMWREIGIDVKQQTIQYSITRERAAEHSFTGGGFLSRNSTDPIGMAVGFEWHHATRGMLNWEFMEDWKLTYDQTLDPDTRLRMAHEMGDFLYDNYVTIPMFWVFAIAAINPDVVVDYRVNMMHFGPLRYHEYTQAVLK